MINRQILFSGDVHGKTAHVISAAQQIQPMAVVLLGDLELTQPAHIELAPIRDIVYFIFGNHDTDCLESWDNLMGSQLADRCVHGHVVELRDGTRLAGLGGIFREKIWAPPSPPVHSSYQDWLTLARGWRKRESMFAAARLKHRSTIFEDVYDQLAAERADILVCHEAPYPHPHGWAALNELAEAMGVRQVWHGHHHDHLDYRAHWQRYGYQIHSVGLRGIAGRNGEVIVAGELDAARGSSRSLQSWAP